MPISAASTSRKRRKRTKAERATDKASLSLKAKETHSSNLRVLHKDRAKDRHKDKIKDKGQDSVKVDHKGHTPEQKGPTAMRQTIHSIHPTHPTTPPMVAGKPNKNASYEEKSLAMGRSGTDAHLACSLHWQ